MKDKPVILIVDDQPQNIELLEAYLVPQGYEIVKAANGEEALGKLSDHQIDLILLDVIMPGMDGFEVTRRVRQDNTHRLLPIILVTVLWEREDRVKGIEAGCDDFISKPVDKMELLARVRSLLKVKAYNDLMSNYRKELEVTKISADEAREYAESIINTVREPLIALDQDLRVVTVSRSFYEVFKVKPEETMGQLIYDLGNKQWDIPKLRELLETILPQKTTFDNYEVEHDFTTIGRRIMLLNARQIKRVFGKERIILLAIEDITEHRRLEILLSESEERYRRLFETANDGILLLEKSEGNITHANPAVTAMLGYCKEECIGNKLQDIGFSHDMGDFQEIMHTLDRSGIIYYDDVPIKTKAGQTFYVDIYLVDRARLVQCNIRNITERKQAEEALRKSERELRSKTENLEEVNAALNVLLKRVEEGRIELEEKILSNIRELVLPNIDRLKKTQLSDQQASYLMVIETNLDNIASSFLYHLKMRYLNLTHREVQVASLVKEGKSTKEIAELLNIAIKTVVFHRNSLRNKLGLKNQKANLRAHLLTFT
jgi:PAS domain S-box-containing protein